jgi:hypothetical protein
MNAFEWATFTLCGANPSTAAGFDGVMLKAGFRKDPKGAWWEFVEAAGTTQV